MKKPSIAMLTLVALAPTLMTVSRASAEHDAQTAASTAAAPSPPAIGQPAPDFSLPSTTGRDISLADYRGKKTVVLYFYPKDQTPGCTKEACDFRDHSLALKDAGVVILGVSNDDIRSHLQFRDKEHLPFPLLADVDARVSKLYGVYKRSNSHGKESLGIERTTFVVGKDGRIAQVWPRVNVDGHVAEVLKFVARG